MFKETNTSNPHWERQVLQNVLLEHLTEQRRARRWSLFFKFLFIITFFGLFLHGYSSDTPQPKGILQAHTAVIDITGEIAAEATANAEDIRIALRKAFANKHVKGVVLRINSPGGSPVQSHQIYQEMRELRAKHPSIKVYAAIEDMGTSAAYLIASGADAIYADQTSLVGSIGVRMDSFGFVDVMNKVGIERRLYTAGQNKGILDPFLPRKPEEEAFIKQQLQSVHEIFIANVKEGRGTRLHITPDIFSGLFWNGTDALKLGLIDGFGDTQYIAKTLVKNEHLVDYTPSSNLIDKISNKIGASMGAALASKMGVTAQQGLR